MTESIQQTKQKPTDLQTYKRLLKYVWPYKVPFILSIIGFMFYSAMDVLAVDIMQYLIDNIGGVDAETEEKRVGIISTFLQNNLQLDPNNTADARVVIPVTIFILAFMRGMGGFVGNYFIKYAGNHVVFDIRQQMFKQLVHLPTSYITSRQSGTLVSRITYNVNQVSGAVTNAITILFREGLSVTFLMSYLLYLNWRLTLTFIVVVPFVAVVVNYVSKRFRRLSKRLQNSVGDVTHVISETVNGNRDMRIYGAQDYEIERFSNASQNTLKQQMKMASTNAAFSPTVQVLLTAAICLLIWLGLDPEIISSMSAGLFVSFLLAAAAIGKPLRQLTSIVSTIQKALAAAEDIFLQLDEPVEQDKATKKIDNVKGNVRFENVSFSYPNQKEKTLKGVSFEIEAGKTLALVGASGSGKSTIANLLPRFYNIDEGAIYIDDQPIHELDLASLRSHIALVSQNVVLSNDTVMKNIAYGELRHCSEEEIIEASKKANVHQFVQELDKQYQTEIGDNGVMLSGGQRQRLAIARAILKNAPILILDEATSALDNESERLIQASLARVSSNCTSIVIAHRLSTIENADKILVIHDGEVVEQGDHKSLMAMKGRYYDLQQSREDGFLEG